MIDEIDNQMDFFVMNLIDVASKSDQKSMEHPMFSLSKRKDMRILEYSRKNVDLKIIPSGIGRANIWDKNILIHCASQIAALINRGGKINKTVRMGIYSFLKATHCSTGGRAYDEVEKKLIRLHGTTIIWREGAPNGSIERKPYNFIDDWTIIEKDNNGKLGEVEIVLSDWFIGQIEKNGILTISPEYFNLTNPSDMRLYELARKHCGKQAKWEIGFDNLFEKMGIHKSQKRKFRMKLRSWNKKADNFLDYHSICDYFFKYDDKNNKLIVVSKEIISNKA